MRSCLRLQRPSLFLFVGSFLLLCAFSPELRAEPPAGHTWIPLPELSDDFDHGKLDTSKWWDHNPTWLGRQPGLFSPSNVTVDDDGLHLTARNQEPPSGTDSTYHTFTTAAVKSKSRGLYGYYEIKARPMNSSASSAFWFYAQDPSSVQATTWTELDVFEICGKPDRESRNYHMNAHVAALPELKGKQIHNLGTVWKAPFRFADDFHLYALDWEPDLISWYVDGRSVRTSKNTYWHQPLNLNFDSETMPEWFGLPDPKDLPSTFTIKYVHAWRRGP